jgi:tetratricopeptide (TPR) repeat protein
MISNHEEMSEDFAKLLSAGGSRKLLSWEARLTEMMLDVDDGEQWKKFSASDFLARQADTGWEKPKSLGNELLKAGDHCGAAKLYRSAALLAKGALDSGVIHAFIETLQAWPEESAHCALVSNEDLLWDSIVPHLCVPKTERTLELPNGETWVAKYPNKGAAISWSNCAQALLLAGDAEGALAAAREATVEDPEYTKGHHREMKALELLGRKREAADITKKMRQYTTARSLYPSESVALLAVGWIDLKRATLVYGPIRFKQAAEHVAQSLAQGVRKVEARASIVPFQGGQSLMLTLVYAMRSTIECMDFVMVDNQNADMADQPPNGHASPLALEHAPMRIGVFIHDLAEYELQTVAVMCGQGLTQHVAYIERKLREGHEGMHPPIDSTVIVYPASSTAASEDAGMPTPFMGSPLSEQAAMARLAV